MGFWKKLKSLFVADDDDDDDYDDDDYDDDDYTMPLGEWTVEELRDECAERNISGFAEMTKDELIHAVYTDVFVNEHNVKEMRDYLEELGHDTRGLTRQGMIDMYMELDKLNEAEELLY